MGTLCSVNATGRKTTNKKNEISSNTFTTPAAIPVFSYSTGVPVNTCTNKNQDKYTYNAR